MKIILFGAPGAGKGTQAEKIAQKYNIPTISTGNIIREAIKQGTETGLMAKSYTDNGRLVPDEVVIGIIKERLAQADCADGFLLDGFPRTIPQAEALDALGFGIDTVLDIDVDDEDIVARMSGRRVCPACGNSYHVKNNPSKDGKSCDGCGAELVTRKDDMPETVIERLQVFHTQTEPLKDYYGKAGKLVTVNGRRSVAETTEEIFAALEERK